MPSRRTTLRTLGAALAGLGAGCTGTDDPSTAPSPDGATPTTARPTTTTTPTGSPSRSGTDGPPLPADARWVVTTDSPVTGLTVHDEQLLVATADGTLSARDPTDGSELWRFAAPNSLDSSGAAGRGPLVVDDTLLIVSESFDGLHSHDNAVHAVDLGTGAERWRYAPGRQYAAFSLLGVVDGAVVVGDNDDALGSGDHETVAIELTDGSERWSRTTTDVLAGTTGPEAVYAGTASTLSALAAADGSVRWTREEVQPRWVGAGGGAVYAAFGGDTVAAIAPATGAVRWRPSGTAVSPVADTDLYVGGSSIRRFAPDGTVRWSVSDSGIPELLAGDRLLAEVGDRTLASLSRADGTVQWRASVAEFASPVGIADGTVVVLSETSLTGLAATDGRERWSFEPGAGEVSSPALGETAAFVATTPDGPEGPGRVYARPYDAG
jgi:outer membrane protein assembly factor BamB